NLSLPPDPTRIRERVFVRVASGSRHEAGGQRHASADLAARHVPAKPLVPRIEPHGTQDGFLPLANVTPHSLRPHPHGVPRSWSEGRTPRGPAPASGAARPASPARGRGGGGCSEP